MSSHLSHLLAARAAAAPTGPPAVGDYVRLDDVGTKAQRAQVFQVTDVHAGGDLILTAVGGGRGMRVPAGMLARIEPGTPAHDAIKAKHAAAADQPPVHPGAVVTVKHPGWKDGDVLCVVLAVAVGTVKLTKLGGMDGSSWRNIPVTALTVVDPATITVKG